MAMPANYAYVCVRWTLPDGQNAFIKLWFITTAEPLPETGDEEAALLAEQCDTQYTTALRNTLSQEAVLDGYRAYIVTPTGTFSAFRGVGLAGSITGDMAPNFVAAIVQRRRAAPGKKAIGRVFLPAIPETYTDDNTLSTAAESAVLDVADAFGSSLTVGENLYSPGFHSPADDTLTAVVAWSRVNLLARMGSRKARN